MPKVRKTKQLVAQCELAITTLQLVLVELRKQGVPLSSQRKLEDSISMMEQLLKGES